MCTIDTDSLDAQWWFGLPNSSSHCLIGALIGIALGNAFVRERSLIEGVHWSQVWTVLEALALSPVLGFVLSAALYFGLSRTVHDKRLYQPAGKEPPVWWMRGVLILTCTGVSFAHGTNDGQKSIGLIMLTIIGLFPAIFALNPTAGQALADLPKAVQTAEPLIQKYGDDRKDAALDAAKTLESYRAPAPTSNPSLTEFFGLAADKMASSALAPKPPNSALLCATMCTR